jgi:hypothetical protein
MLSTNKIVGLYVKLLRWRAVNDHFDIVKILEFSAFNFTFLFLSHIFVICSFSGRRDDRAKFLDENYSNYLAEVIDKENNKSGPRTEPCGTPISTSIVLLKTLTICINILLSF